MLAWLAIYSCCRRGLYDDFKISSSPFKKSKSIIQMSLQSHALLQLEVGMWFLSFMKMEENISSPSVIMPKSTSLVLYETCQSCRYVLLLHANFSQNIFTRKLESLWSEKQKHENILTLEEIQIDLCGLKYWNWHNLHCNFNPILMCQH